jgi:hypothetical protein
VEIVLALALLLLVAVSAAVAGSHLAGARPSEACLRLEAGLGPDPILGPDPSAAGCRAEWRAFRDFVHEEAQKVIGLAAFAPFIVGLLLGVPLGARLGSTPPDARPGRALLSRAVPSLALLVAGLSVTVLLIDLMQQTATDTWAQAGSTRSASLADLTVEPLTFVARGILAFGVGLLGGTLTRRRLPGYALGTLVLLLAVVAAVWPLQGLVAERTAAWRACGSAFGCEGQPSLYWLTTGAQDPGDAFLTAGEARELARASCATCADEDAVEAWVSQNLAWAELVVPQDRYPAFVITEAALFTAVGLACLLLAIPLLGRRQRAQADRASMSGPATGAGSACA